ETVMVSSIAPTFISALIGSVTAADRANSSRLTVANPVRLNVTAYVPGRRSTILYWPCASVTTDRVFSMSAGLLASTVTPGSTAPLVSRTTPAIDPWAKLSAGSATRPTIAKRVRAKLMRINDSPQIRVAVVTGARVIGQG